MIVVCAALAKTKTYYVKGGTVTKNLVRVQNLDLGSNFCNEKTAKLIPPCNIWTQGCQTIIIWQRGVELNTYNTYKPGQVCIFFQFLFYCLTIIYNNVSISVGEVCTIKDKKITNCVLLPC